MIVEASVVGIFKTILIIIGGLVLLRFLGQVMIAKRNMELERDLNNKQRKHNEERDQKLKNFGKTKIIHNKAEQKSKRNYTQTEDIDFEEIKD